MWVLLSDKNLENMSSMENHLATSKMLSDTIVSFKTDSELKRDIQLKTWVTKAFFTLGEIIAIVKIIIGHEKMYDDRNPSVIICSPELELALECKALHVTDIKEKVINHIAFASEYLGEIKGSKDYYPKSKCFATHIWTNKKA